MKRVTKRKLKKKTTEFTLSCPCGAKAPVFQLGEIRYMAHCPGCGALTFFNNPLLLERLRYGGELCPHRLEQKPCKGGFTTWCDKCRVRCFKKSQFEVATGKGR